MTAIQQPVETRNGTTFYDDGLGGLNAYRGPKLVGRASPWVAGMPDGDWYARHLGHRNQPAQRCTSRDEALNYLTAESQVKDDTNV